AVSARDIIQISDPIITDELVEEKRGEFSRAVDEIEKQYKRIAQCRQKLLAIPRAMKPKLFRRQLWELGRLVVKTSRLVRLIRFQTPVIRHLIDCIRAAVEEFKPLEREVARVQRKLETWPGGRAENIKDLRKEQRSYVQRLHDFEEQYGGSAT